MVRLCVEAHRLTRPGYDAGGVFKSACLFEERPSKHGLARFELNPILGAFPLQSFRGLDGAQTSIRRA